MRAAPLLVLWLGCVDLSLPSRPAPETDASPDASGPIDGSEPDRDAGPMDAVVVEGCGDGAIDPPEQCDDGNAMSGDGCNSACTVEMGWSCSGTPSTCSRDPLAARTYLVEVPDPITSNSAAFEDVATLPFTPLDPSEIWLVLVSGLLSSSVNAEIGAELRLMINGVEADLIGHTMAGGDNAGFIVFDRIDGTVAPQNIAVQLRAAAGTAIIDDLRIVAALLPPGSDCQYFEDPAPLERAALDQAIETLAFTPSSAGEYFVLAKASQSRTPSPGAVQTWIETSAGDVRPDAPAGTHFTNPRASRQPMFTAFRSSFTADPQTVSLMGSSSGDAQGPPWWEEEYVHRRSVTVGGTGAAVPAGHPVRLAFDHASLVPNKSLASGDDVRVAHWNGISWSELHRVPEPTASWGRSDTTIWFSTVAQLGSADTDAGYYLYYGNRSPPPPPADHEQIFILWDDFDAPMLDPARWTPTGTFAIGGGVMTPDPGARMIATSAYRAAGRMRAEARAVLPAGTTNITFVGLTDSILFGNSNYARMFTEGADNRWDHSHPGMRTLGYTDPLDVGTVHTYAISRPPANVVSGPTYYEDDMIVQSGASDPPDGNALLGFAIRNDSTVAGPTYEWVRLRATIASEPSTAVSAEEAHSGALPNTWLHRKIMVFRSDAWDLALYAETPELDTTTSDLVTAKTSLSVPDPPAMTEHLVIQALRISASQVAGLRAGVLQRGGSTALETSHAIDADGSRRAGYHHTAGLATIVETAAGFTLLNGFRSPDGATAVESADSAIIVLRYPPR